MADNILQRLNRLASDVLPGRIHTETLGENYYSFAMTNNEGTATFLPHVWIDPNTSDEQIRVKLQRALDEALHPECQPDDASVPNLQEEQRGLTT